HTRGGATVRLLLGFDMRRAPFSPATPTDLYAAAVDVAAWGDGLGFEYVRLGEHHSAEDGYMTSPLMLGAAIASRTTRLVLQPMVLAPFHDPVQVAEDLLTLDLLSAGRVRPIIAAGSRPTEFAMFAADRSAAGVAVEETVELLRLTWQGEPF